jgi:predicted  nucleic acid-binding Zn-ribbon protein
MLNFLFRSRSPQRDRETDQARLARIHQTVRTCVTNAESELNGLRARLEKARQSASMLVGNVDNSEREQASRSELRSAEERLLAAERRIVQLKDHLAALQRIASAVNMELNS